MRKNEVKKLLVGILNFCPQLNIPADSRAAHKSLKKYNDIYPELFSDIISFTDRDFEPFSQEVEDEIDNLMLDGLIGLSGVNFETLIISTNIKNEFKLNKFTKDQIKILKVIGENLFKEVCVNESNRYKKLKKRAV